MVLFLFGKIKNNNILNFNVKNKYNINFLYKLKYRKVLKNALFK